MLKIKTVSRSLVSHKTGALIRHANQPIFGNNTVALLSLIERPVTGPNYDIDFPLQLLNAIFPELLSISCYTLLSIVIIVGGKRSWRK